MEIALVFAAVLAATALALFLGMRGRKVSAEKLAEMSQGTLTVTGVNKRPDEADANGNVFLTISGTIIGLDIAPTEVYGSFVRPLAQPWPQLGDDLAVRYNPRKVDSSWILIADDGQQPGTSTPST